MSIEIAIIAAMEREVRLLVRRWRRGAVKSGDVEFRTFSNGGTMVVCSGIGEQLARQATLAIFASHHPKVVVSAGLAGALDATLRAGQIFQPATVVDMRTGAQFNTCGGKGILVTTSSVLNREAKGRIAGSYGAAAADMEAAAVALVANQYGCPIIIMKAISDEADFDMPSFEGLIDGRGQIRTPRLLVGAIMRPGQWPVWLRLARNSARGSRELSRALGHLIEKEGAALELAPSDKTSS